MSYSRRSLMGRRGLLLLLTVTLLTSLPASIFGHELKDIPTNTSQAKFGLEEQLGKRIPLDNYFRDESGKQVRLRDLISGPTIILPVFYSCSNVCNYLQGGLARILPTIKGSPGSDYRVISLSFDESEGPALAAKYKKMYLTSMKTPFPEDGWRFLTGNSTSIRNVTDAAGYHFQRKGRDYIHPVVSLVVAGDGTIVRYLYGTTFLSKDVSLALAEARNGVVGTSIRKAVGYCFNFDPANKTYVFNLLRVSATVIIVVCGSFMAFLIFGGKKRR